MQLTGRRVGARDPSDDELRAAQLRAQRHRDVARVESRTGRAGEQRRVEHEVRLADERHTGALAGQQPLEGPGGIEAAESAARNDDLPGHLDRIGCVR